MPFCCEKCGRPFRDNYNLKKHRERKTVCVFVPVSDNTPDASGNACTFINNGTINGTVNETVNVTVVLGKDTPTNFNADQFIESWRQINKTIPDEYIRAGKLTFTFNDMVIEEFGKNVKIPNTKSMSALVLNEHGVWKHQPTEETVDRVLRVRSGQLVQFKDTIDQTNNRIFKIPTNQRTWQHLVQFSIQGIAHHAPTHAVCRQLRTLAKVELVG